MRNYAAGKLARVFFRVTQVRAHVVNGFIDHVFQREFRLGERTVFKTKLAVLVPTGITHQRHAAALATQLFFQGHQRLPLSLAAFSAAHFSAAVVFRLRGYAVTRTCAYVNHEPIL